MENEKDMRDEAKADGQEAMQAAEEADAQANEEVAEPEAGRQAESEAEALKRQIAELNDKYVRTCAEYDNYRKRTAREKADLIRSAGSDILAALLPVVDDFERALAHMNDAADTKAVKDGVELIYKKFNDYLTKRGVAVIETKDLPLDTNVHEAITMVPAPSPEMKGKILDCVEKGYTLGDKVLRFAKVVVCQ